MTATPIVLAATPLTGHVRPVLNLALWGSKTRIRTVTLCLPKTSSVQVGGMKAGDPVLRGWSFWWSRGAATVERLSRHDERLCCCDWPT